MKYTEILKKPLITEKISVLNDKSIYGFIVGRKDNKIEIKKSVEKMYGVNVVSVNTIICAGKKKRRHTKKGLVQGKTSGYKKAIVTLKKGEVIDFYSNA